MTATPEAAFAAAMYAMRGPFERGARDCLFCACAASQALFGRDPLASGRPHYTTLSGALRILAKAGGWRSWADQTFQAAGMRRTNDPKPGDICLICNKNASGGLAFGIAAGPSVVAKHEGGVAVLPANIVGAWTWE